MERLTENFHLAPQDSRQTRPLTKGQRALLQNVSELFRRTMASFPSQQLEEATQVEFTEAWLAIARKQTIEALQAAVERHVQFGDGFFPLPATLNKLISGIRQEREAERIKSSRFVPCGKETGRGVVFGGTRCVGGMLVFVDAGGDRGSRIANAELPAGEQGTAIE